MSKTAIFLPWRSEFGTMIMHHVRWARNESMKYERSIVCTRRGLEALYPFAHAFFYDWESPKDEQKNTALLKSKENDDYLKALGEKLLVTYPGADLIFPQRKVPINKAWDFTPRPRVIRQFSTDVVLAPRFRKYGEHRNYNHWPVTCLGLLQARVRMMSIGAEDTSVADLGVDDASWRYDSLDACLEMMQSCKLVLCTESGMAHLAALAGAPVAIIYDAEGKEAGHPKWPWNLPHIKSYAKAYCEPIVGGWNNPQVVVDFVKQYLGK